MLAIGSPLSTAPRSACRTTAARRSSAAASEDRRGSGKSRAARSLAQPGGAPYIHSLRINGHAYARPWTTYCALARGATLAFQLGRRPDRRWGARAAAAPPSFGPATADAEDACAPDASATRAVTGAVPAGLTALGAAVRFASLGVQSYHHDEVITAMRVIPGSFGDMLHAVKASESNPPLYYVLAWGWAKVFGTGEVGLRSLSALFGAATVPLGY